MIKLMMINNIPPVKQSLLNFQMGLHKAQAQLPVPQAPICAHSAAMAL
jgi:hypothetical protein